VRVIQRIARGAAGHPGNEILIGLVVIGALAGAGPASTWTEFVIGAVLGGGVMLIAMGIPWCIGAWERGKEDA